MTGALFVERERKFELDPGRAVPDLSGVGPIVTQRSPELATLEAVYYDTEDCRLLKAGVTLRRRAGGGDAGWHLKVPAGKDTREEYQLPLSDELPAELRERMEPYAKGARITEIARLKTERYTYELCNAAGRRLAVLTDDHVTGEKAGAEVHLDGWRELEVELEEGADTGLLDTLSEELTNSGARPGHWPSKLKRLLADWLPEDEDVGRGSTAGEVVLAYLRDQVDAVRRWDIGVRKQEEDAVHQLRVSLRRLRSALRSFRRVLDRGRTRELADELQWLGRVLSDARDLEVLREGLARQFTGLPGETSSARRVVDQHFERAEREAWDSVAAALDSARYAALLGALEKLTSEPPLTENAGLPARRELQHALDRADRRLVRAVDELSDAEDEDSALHSVRKKAKQARYAADAVRPVFGRRVREWRRGSKRVQTTLGDHHDLVETRKLLRDLAGMTGPREAFVLGVLHERAAVRGEELRKRFLREWAGAARL
ncbi:CYTH and CHAD domain-containing protein [Amycolatopsis acidicola]|uniref:CYTH and CHAD domain-containing protein n=1 Tax=Amycolatopsis acidicola TaxID=2596893 RepID=A0A5N0UTC4_9PSEU|nr:CYTH and CHAD domain-containing protein [Amycolatopsis acidicola]KAA9153172.1 CYTH and CHAD domain-containing protein [Amycolatopsis acidicola]